MPDPTPTHTAAMSLERISELEAMAERCRSAQTQATLNMHDIGNRAAMAAGAYTSALIAAAPALLAMARDAAVLREAMEKIALQQSIARAALEQIKRTAAGGKGEGT